MNIHVKYFQRMVRNGFFIGKRILSAFPRYARLASHEQAVEKDSYALPIAASSKGALDRFGVNVQKSTPPPRLS